VIKPERIQPLNDAPERAGDFVLYWMQQSQRAEWNHALEHAIHEANRLGLPVVAAFGVTDTFPEANERHYAFMFQGLADTEKRLRRRGIKLVIRQASPDEAALALADRAALLIVDRGYLRIQKQWRANVARSAPCRVVQVESDVAVPVETASAKEEYAARTIRPKINRQLASFLVPLERAAVRTPSLAMRLDGIVLPEHGAPIPAEFRIDRSVSPVASFRGGVTAAGKLLDAFIAGGLGRYPDDSSDPALGVMSNMSPYLHFGQVSPVEIALRVRDSGAPREAVDAFLEQLIVRRELSINFVHFNPAYDSVEAVPSWARQSLEEHRADPREYVYAPEQLERAETHDAYWNAAQMEMALTGKMHNTMRMYWGKKILEWSETPEQAFATTLRLNDRYELDGRDANGFTGVAWCFGKHDRPWQERPIFGKVRYMNANGLKRKYRIDDYVRHIAALDGTA